MVETVETLASFRHCSARMRAGWSAFQDRRRERLAEGERWGGSAVEKVAEGILEDLFTTVLDWSLSDLNHQVGYADLELSRLGIKYLIIEVKRPGALAWSRRAVDAALDQARRYGDEQKVHHVAVSDGAMLYAADVVHGGLEDRVFANLEAAEPPESLWWLSVNGIYRPRREHGDAVLRLLPDVEGVPQETPEAGTGVILHPKYKVPAHCFAYVGRADDPHTWKLPYRLADGRIDLKRLPKAIQAILSNYRGVRVSGVPEPAIPDVLVRLALAASALGRMPHQGGETAPVYVLLAEALDQEGRLEEVKRGGLDG